MTAFLTIATIALGADVIINGAETTKKFEPAKDMKIVPDWHWPIPGFTTHL